MHHPTRLGLRLLFATLVVSLCSPPVSAQGSLFKQVKERVKRRVADTVAERAAREAGKATDAVLDAATAPAGPDAADAAGTADPAASPAPSADAAATAIEAPGGEPSPSIGIEDEDVWANFDFVPGDRVLFAEDFSGDRVGDFPRRLELVRGSFDVVEVKGRRFLRSLNSTSQLAVALPEVLPERFTLEFEMFSSFGMYGLSIATTPPKTGSTTWAHYLEQSYFSFGHRSGSGVRTKDGLGPTSVTDDRRPMAEVVTARVMVDGSYVKVYINEKRVANVPNAVLERTDRLYFISDSGGADKPSYLGNLRVAAGGRALYDALTTDGRVVARGILFETDAAALRPESSPVLREIGDVLDNHGDLRLRIEGHTDGVGSAVHNQRLSERRARAVQRYLVERRGVAADRLDAVGLGSAVPVDTNDTAEGRQNNRRVELVTLDPAGEQPTRISDAGGAS